MRRRFGGQVQRASMTKPRILVVADDAALRATLARWLMTAGYAVELAESPKRARQVAETSSIALTLLAPERLGPDGIELARELGGQGANVLFIEAEAGEAAAGPAPPADRTLGRPLREPDVLARIKSLLGAPPIAEPASGPRLLCFEGYTLDADGRTCVDAGGQEVTLTRAEFSLLLALVRQPGRVLSRDELSQAVTGREAEPDDRSVDVLMSRLRRKIEPDPKTPRIIVTVPGVGYKFTAKPQEVAAPPATATAIAVTGAPVGTAGQNAQVQATLVRDATAPGSLFHRHRARALPIAAVVVLAAAALGWAAWSNRAALPPPAEMTQPPGTSDEARRATVYKRMVAVMQDDRFDWRTVERLAIDAGVNEAEAHAILAEHPGEVMLGKSREGKLIARLAER
jgi:two-component system OmpR family response regulator